MVILETLKRITFVGKILGEFSVLGGATPHYFDCRLCRYVCPDNDTDIWKKSIWIKLNINKWYNSY